MLFKYVRKYSAIEGNHAAVEREFQHCRIEWGRSGRPTILRVPFHPQSYSALINALDFNVLRK